MWNRSWDHQQAGWDGIVIFIMNVWDYQSLQRQSGPRFPS